MLMSKTIYLTITEHILIYMNTAYSNSCYVQVIVTQSTEGCAEPQEIKTLGVGDYFGEKALIRYKQQIYYGFFVFL